MYITNKTTPIIIHFFISVLDFSGCEISYFRPCKKIMGRILNEIVLNGIYLGLLVQANSQLLFAASNPSKLFLLLSIEKNFENGEKEI